MAKKLVFKIEILESEYTNWFDYDKNGENEMRRNTHVEIYRKIKELGIDNFNLESFFDYENNA